MKAYSIRVGGERYIVLAMNTSKALKKAIAARDKEYPGTIHDASELQELWGTVLR